MQQDCGPDRVADKYNTVVQAIERAEQRSFPGGILRIILIGHARIVDLVGGTEFLSEALRKLAIRIGNLPDSNLVATKVGMIRRAAYASPAYLSRRGTPARPEELATHDCITFEGFNSPRIWTFVEGKREVDVPVQSRLSVTTAEAAADAAAAELGVTRLLSYQAQGAVSAGKLVLLLEDFEPPAWPVSAVYVAQGRTPLKLRAFVDFAVPLLRERMAALSLTT